MKLKSGLLICAYGAGIIGTILFGSHLAHRPAIQPRVVADQTRAPSAPHAPSAVKSQVPPPPQMASVAMAQPLQEAASSSPDDLRRAMNEAGNVESKARYAEALATQNTESSVKALLDGIGLEKEWATRAALAKHLRAVSDPDTLPALVPALLNNYGRGNTILNEIVDSIGRMAQPDTVEALAALHWQASTQAGQGHKVLKAVAAIRNPPAMRGLARLAERAESPSLAAAAQEALKLIPE